MIGIVIVTHGNLADEFVSAMQHVVGHQEQVETACIGPNDDMNNRREDILNKVNKVDYLAIEKMKLTFSRGFTKGFIFKETNKEFTNTYRPSHLGVKVGKVISTKNDKVQIKLSDGVRQKDKIAIVQDKFEDIRMFLSKIYVKGKLVAQGYKDEIIELTINSKVSKDATIYKIVDDLLVKEIEETYFKNVKRIPIRMKFISNVNEPMALIVKDSNNHSILVKSSYIVEKAINSPTSASKIEEQLSKLSSTSYSIGSLNILTDNEGIIPVKYINDLRREAILKLDEARQTIYNRNESDINNTIEYVENYKYENKKWLLLSFFKSSSKC